MRRKYFDKQRDKKNLSYLLLSLVPIFICVAYIVDLNKYPIGWNEITVKDSVVEAVELKSPYEFYGIEVGDKLLSFNNNRSISNLNFLEAGNPYDTWIPFEAGINYNIFVERNDEILSLNLTFKSLWSIDELFFIFYYGLIFVIVLSGIYILLKRPADNSAKIFYLFCLVLSNSFHTRYFFTSGSIVPSLFFIISYPLISVLFIHFMLVFPEGEGLNRKLKRVLIVIYALGIFFSLIHSISYLEFSFARNFENNVFNPLPRIAANYWMGLSILFAVVFGFVKYSKLKDSFSKNQFRWIIIGFSCGVLVPLLFGILQPVIHINEEFIWANSPNILLYINGIGTPIMLGCILIAITKYKVWNIETIIKKGLLYSGTTFIVIGLYFLFINIAESFLSESAGTARIIGIATAALAFFPVREGIQNKVNKIFYREELDPAKAIYHFENNLLGIYEKEKLCPAILNEINRIFHFEDCAIYVLKHSNIFYNLCTTENKSEVSKNEIPANNEFVNYLIKVKPFALNQLNNKVDLPGTEIITPLMNEKNIFGFLTCGRKKSQEIFTLQEINFLQLLAQRIVSLINTSDLYKKELERQLEVERERARISRDMHDDIGSSLTKISIISELIRKKFSTTDEMNEQLEEIAQSSRGTISNISEIIWAINPSHDSLDDLISYLNNYCSEFLDGTSTQFKFCGPERLPELKLTSEQRRNVFLTVKEALNNAVKYSEAEMIVLEIKIDKTSIYINVKDDGKGFDIEDKTFGNGLKNMKSRIEEAGGNFSIFSSNGKGTIAQIQLNK